ncbi:MAG: biotin transporter BioY, partial [Clostridia bacterium]
PIIDFFGTAFMCWFQKMGILEAVIAAVLPFLLGDIIKCVVASYLGIVLNKVLNPYRGERS